MKTTKKIQMNVSNSMTFEEGCKEYLENCKARNLRNGTLRHYTDTITQLYKYIDPEMQIEDITIELYDQFIKELRNNDAVNDTTLYTYGRDLKTILYYFMRQEYTEL